ncbi:MAG: hypothetical protein KDI46_04475 [Alphaproteobacteria bacterium]|nr:hypothetical protein [Alphaproteobacteria bacterium]
MFEIPAHLPASRSKESGNVLFLILIAVALFAALSYAVTQSSRSGGGDASSETNLISSATITQYPASVRTAIIRMMVSSGVDPADLNFDPPSAFATTCNATPTDCVFHPSGGGATFAPAPADVMASGNPGTWVFNGDFEVVNLGTSSNEATAGNEVIAFLPGIKSSICDRINSELSFGTTPTLSASRAGNATTIGYMHGKVSGELTMASAGDLILGTGGDETSALFDGEAFGCFRNGGGSGDYVYYHVLVER